ncbi:PucR family transcriptional regulator [Promicromonospora soli]
MAPRVSDLIAYPGLRLTVHATAHRLDAPIRWVATSEHLDPTPFLDGGELLLTTGMLIPADEAQAQAYADRLARAGVVALGLGVGLVHDVMPSSLIRAAERAGLLLLEVPQAIPFIAVTKAMSDLVAKEQYAETVRISQMQRELVRAAARDGPAGVVRSTARLSGGWVLLLDRDLVVQQAHPQRASERAAELREELARLGRGGPAASSIVERDESISINTLATVNRTHAYLAVGLPRRPDGVDRALLSMSTSILSVALARPAGSSQRADEYRRTAALIRVVRALATVDQDLLTDLGGPLFGHPEIVVAVVTGGRRDLDGLCLALKDQLFDDCLVTRVDQQVTAIVAGGVASAAKEQIARFQSLRAGVSLPATPSALAQALDDAERSCTRAVTLDIPVVTPSGGTASVFSIADPGQAVAFAERLLAPLTDYEQRTGNDLVESLDAWLRHHGRFEPAAAELGLHRHTLADRVKRAEKLIGNLLDDVDARMGLWFALRTRGTYRPASSGRGPGHGELVRPSAWPPEAQSTR